MSTPSQALPARGILRPERQDRQVRRDVLPACAGLATWVEHHWSVAWSGIEPAFTAEVVSHPSVHLTIESGSRPRFGVAMPAGLVHGVVTRRFSQEITGEGRVFGVKFRPGGCGAFTGADVGAWTDRVEPLAAAFGPAARELTEAVLALDDDRERAGVVEAFLLARVPERDPRYDEVLAVVEAIRGTPR